MSITTQAQAGVQVNSPAKNGTLGSQASATGLDEVDIGSAITTGNNGNLESTPTYVGRKIIINRGLGSEETRYIKSVAGTVVTVNSPFDVNPASSDTYAISYNIADAATVTGLTYQSKADFYASGRRLQITNGGYFAMTDGAFLETSDNGSTTTADVTVVSGGRFDIGYEQSGKAAGGGFIVGTPASVGELVLDVQSGGEFIANDMFLRCVQRNKSILAGDVLMRRAKLYKAVEGADWQGIVSLYDSVVEGLGNSTETLLVDDSSDFDGVLLANTGGFSTPGTGVTITKRNVTFLGNAQKADINGADVMRLVDPSGDAVLGIGGAVGSSSFDLAASATAEWLYSFDLTLTDAVAAAIQTAAVYIYEATLNQDLPHSGQSDSVGVYSVDILENVYSNSGGNLAQAQRGGFRVNAYKYGYNPYSSPVGAAGPEDRPVTMLADELLSGISESTALAVTGIAISDHRSAPVTRQGKLWSWEVDCNGDTPLNAYANLRARYAENPSTAPAIIKALIEEDQNLIEVSGGKFVTVRKAGNGVYLTNFTGNTGAMTADDGTTYTPPTSRTLTIEVKAGGVGITGYEWRLYEESVVAGEIGTVALDGEETAVSSTQVYGYNFPPSNANAVVQVIASGYEEITRSITLGDADQTVTLDLTTETNT